MVQMESKAYQCTKFTTVITTQRSFFGDIKDKEVTSESASVTAAECAKMVAQQQCDAGTLIGGDGIYITNNPVDAKYILCCKNIPSRLINTAISKLSYINGMEWILLRVQLEMSAIATTNPGVVHSMMAQCLYG